MNHARSITRAETLERGRESFRKGSWGAAFSQLSAADQEEQLEPQDLQCLATSANLTGRDDAGAEIFTRAHQAFLAVGDLPGAARCAFWLGFGLLNNGELAQAGGWLARGHRLLDDGQSHCVEQGYLLVPDGIRSAYQGDGTAALAAFVQAAEIGEHFGDRDLITMALMGQGRVWIRLGEIPRGLSLLDESMIAITAGEVSPQVAGGVYCSVIEACGEIFDLSRAHEWTSALERWCGSQPDLVPFRGQCLVRRAELLQLRGAWQDALDQAQQACARLSQPVPKSFLGAAFYRIAEVNRLRGEFAAAHVAYQQASQLARTPQPGVAQLLLAEGRLDGAVAAITNVASGVKDPGARARILGAYVEIMLAAKDVGAARSAADELAEIAARFHSQFLNAVAVSARGAVLLAEQDVNEALAVLRQALVLWRDIDAPYEAARVQVLAALACRQLGDRTTAEMEFEGGARCISKFGRRSRHGAR